MYDLANPQSDYDKFWVLGCPANYYVIESKMDPRAKKVIFLGFSSGVKGYRLWNFDLKKIILSKDVTFDEFDMLKQEDKEKYNMISITTQSEEFEIP